MAASSLFEDITGPRLWQALQALSGFGFIDLSTSGGRSNEIPVARLHALVHDRTSAYPDTEPAGYLSLAAHLLMRAAAAPETGRPEDPWAWSMWRRLTPHAIRLLDNFVEEFAYPDDSAAAAAFAANMAARYQASQGQYAQAAAVFHRVQVVRDVSLGPDHPDTLTTRYEIARMTGERGDYGAAEAEFRDILAVRLRVLGPDHPDTLTTRYEIARMTGERGDYGAAEAEFRDILAVRLRVLGPDHPDTLTTRYEIARMTGERGDYGAAEAEFRDILAVRLRVLGPDHPDTLTTRYEIARMTGERGDYGAAEAEFRDILAVRLRVLGPDHPDTLTSRYEITRTAGWRVFVSHTSELRDFPRGASYVAAVERAISAAGHVIVDMADFPAADLPAAQLCAERVRRCDVYVGVLGTRYGSPVRDMPQLSYTELEFDAATEAGLDRLVFLLDTDAEDVGIPVSRLIDREFGARQEAFRRRVRDSGLTVQSFASPAGLGQLVERSLRDLAQTRQRTGSGSRRGQVPAVVAVGDIPQEPAGFQPRADLLAELGTPSARGRVSVVHVLTGMRGVGKTQLAAAYARARLDEGWRLVAWVNAEDSASVRSGLAEVASALGLDAGTGDAAQSGRAMRHRLESDGDRCLLVFDNATDPADLLPFLPAAGQARVLITSNEQSVADLGAGVAVDVFTEAEALAFLAGRTGLADSGGARLLAGELSRLPLALAQAAAVIAAQHLDYPSYLQRLRDKPVDQMLLRAGTDRYPHGLAAAVLLALDAVRARDGTGVCSAVVDLMSVLSAAGVPRVLLHAAGQAGSLTGQEQAGAVPPQVVDEALGRLVGSSLLTFNVAGTIVTAHRLVMRVIRERLARQGHLTTTCQAAVGALEARAASLYEAWQDRPARRDLVEQIMALQEHSASSPGEADGDLTRAILTLRGRAAWFLNELGDSPAQAIGVAEPLLADQEQILGPDHPDTMQSRSNLAVAYRDAGRAAEAIPLHERTLADRERILGPDHPSTMQSRSNLAVAYRDAGRAAEAIPLHERTLADRERILGPDHPSTMQSRSNLAVAYRDAGRAAEAIPLYERTLADMERVLGPDHPSSLASRSNLASAYWETGRAAEAIPLYERTLADMERVLGPDHPSSLASRSNLASAYRDAGRAAEAIPLYERTLADRERILGPDHPDTQRSRNNLAAARASGT